MRRSPRLPVRSAWLFAALLAPAAVDAGQLEASSWRTWGGATGDWGGARTRLAEHGLDVFARYTTGFWSNTKGGIDTGTRYEGFATWGFGVDLHRLVRWPGASFRMTWNSYHGGQPSEELVGQFPTETLSGWEAAIGVRFYEIAFSQELWQRRVRIEVGQLTSDGEFFQSATSAQLLNGTFGFLGFSRQLTPFYPLAAPGVFVGLRTRDARFELRSAIYTAAVGEDVIENIGFDWSFDDGFTAFGEAIARPELLGRRASFSLGFVGVRSSTTDPNSGEIVKGRVSLYGVADWEVIESEASHAGLGFFVRMFGTPDVGTAPTDWYFSSGFALVRPLPGRELDAFAFGFTVQSFGDEYVELMRSQGEDVSERESIVELGYRAQVFRWLAVQPDLQLVIDPHFSRRNAVAVGLNVVIDL